MANLEQAGLTLALEVEMQIRLGKLVPMEIVLALNEFRKVQVASEAQVGVDLEAMFRQYIGCPIIRLDQHRKNQRPK